MFLKRRNKLTQTIQSLEQVLILQIVAAVREKWLRQVHTCCTVVVTIVPVLVFEEILATCVPANAKNKKDVVPTNSPMTATV